MDSPTKEKIENFVEGQIFETNEDFLSVVKQYLPSIIIYNYQNGPWQSINIETIEKYLNQYNSNMTEADLEKLAFSIQLIQNAEDSDRSKRIYYSVTKEGKIKCNGILSCLRK